MRDFAFRRGFTTTWLYNDVALQRRGFKNDVALIPSVNLWPAKPLNKGTLWPWRWQGTSYSISLWREGLRKSVPSTRGNCSNTGRARWHRAQLTTLRWLALRADSINLLGDTEGLLHFIGSYCGGYKTVWKIGNTFWLNIHSLTIDKNLLMQ